MSIGKLANPAGLMLAVLILSMCGGPGRAREARFLATGQRYMEKKDYARAILQFKNAAQVSPTSAEPYYQLGLAFLETGDFRSAVASLMKATELNPRHVAAQAKLSQLMSTSRDPEVLAEASRRAQAAHAADPGDVAALDALAQTEWSKSQPEEAEQHLQEALQKLPGHLKSATMLANIKLAKKDFAGAEEVLRKAAETGSATPEARVALGGLYNLENKPADAEREFQEALKIRPDYAPALLELARLRVRQGKRDDAERIYKRVASLPDKTYRPAYALFLLYLVDANRGISELEKLHRQDPADREVRSRLVDAYLVRRRFQDAQRLLDDELKRNPKDVDALLARGRLLEALQLYDAAERDLNKALQLDGSLAQAHLSLALVYGARGETLRQRQELNEALRLDPQSRSARLALANEYIRANSAQAALDVLGQAPANQQRALDFMVARNWALLGAGKLPEARQGIDAGLAAVKSPELLLQDADLRFRQKDISGGRKSLESILKQDPGHLGALDLLIESYARAGQAAAGLQKLRAYGAQRSSSAAVQNLLAGWFRRYGNYKEARAAANAAKAAEPKALAADLMLAELDLLEGHVDPARQRLSALPQDQRSRPEVHLLLALADQQAGNYSAAIQHYRAILAVSPQSVVAMNNLAYLLVEYGNRTDEGLQYAQKVQELKPDDPAVEDTIGWAFFYKGLYPTAVGHLERAVAKNGQSAASHFHLAMAYFKAGDRQRAHQMLQAGLRLDPRVPEAKQARALIAPAAGQAR